MMPRRWFNWGIAARLLAIVVLPAGSMFIAVAATLYFTTQNDVHRDVAERGRLIATALAQSSQYGLVSGNAQYLETTLHHLLDADLSIVCISITGDARQTVASTCRVNPPTVDSSFEVPVHIEVLADVDLFEPTPPPEPGAIARRLPNTNAPLRAIGHVRVDMSATPIFQAKRRALLVAFGFVWAAAVLSCLVGMQLSKRLRHTLASVMVALRAIRQGHFDVHLSADHQGELGELQRTILQMATTLNAARHELEQQVASRTEALQEAMSRVQQADHEKRQLIRHSNACVEDDRRRIALEIHDHLGASLISVRLEAAALVAKAEVTGDADVARGARRIATTAESLYSSTRNIVKSLRPEVIDTLGLSGAIEEMVRSFDKVHPGCRFAFRADVHLPDLRGELAMPAYRVAQEALTNAVKHAKATQVLVTLSLQPDADHLRIVVADNGVGFDVHQKNSAGFGLMGMRERVAAVGGEFELDAAPGEGTRVCVTLKMPGRLAA